MTTFEKLAVRIKKDLDIDLTNFKRMYSGHWQRSAGSWSWKANHTAHIGIVGSQWGANELLKAKSIETFKPISGDLEIIASD